MKALKQDIQKIRPERRPFFFSFLQHDNSNSFSSEQMRKETEVQNTCITPWLRVVFGIERSVGKWIFSSNTELDIALL